MIAPAMTRRETNHTNEIFHETGSRRERVGQDPRQVKRCGEGTTVEQDGATGDEHILVLTEGRH